MRRARGRVVRAIRSGGVSAREHVDVLGGIHHADRGPTARAGLHCVEDEDVVVAIDGQRERAVELRLR